MAIRVARTATDSGNAGTYYFLDVGRRKYGDCILVVFDDVRILIDGSHKEDFDNPSEGQDSIPDQLDEIFGEPGPHPITLLVVTHCHADHIGCLPELVTNDVIRPEWALVTHPRLGFGRSLSDDGDADLADDRSRKIAAALREEDMSDLDDAELAEFLDAAATVESRYGDFLADLNSKGVRVVAYHGQVLPAALQQAVSKSGMKLLGPTRDQLVACADQIATTNKDSTDNLSAALDADGTMDDVELYRSLTAFYDNSDARANPRGSGMNCQSITLAFGPDGSRALLAGDMQFSEPGVSGIDDEMARLRQKIADHGPYHLFKTTHHTSHNGIDVDLLPQLGDPPLIVHTGGLNDASHPHPTALKLLKSVRRQKKIDFARTDRNGRIAVEPHANPELDPAKGKLNVYTDNASDVAAEGELEVAGPMAEHFKVRTVRGNGNGQILIVNLPAGPVNMSVGGVDISVRSADSAPRRTPRANRITTTRRRDPALAPPEPERPAAAQDQPLRGRNPARRTGASSAKVELAPGRELPHLLFVTNSEGLRDNIGADEANAVINAIRDKGHPIADVGNDLDQASRAVNRMLRDDGRFEGVVIVGGYDIVPSVALDVLGPALRTKLGGTASAEHDGFYVWSDETYGDLEEDKVAELPVSRIPDARQKSLVFAALQAPDLRTGGRFGIRNLARPFADSVWKGVAGTQAVNVSEKFLHSDASPAAVSATCQYFMLHGSDSDSTEFRGETPAGGLTLAYTVRRVPDRYAGLVFSGCCWGALTVSQKASAAGHSPIAPRAPERSIALSYLRAGANAFIGSTGAHYSGPDVDPDENFALPLHNAFWRELQATKFKPSLALHRARLDFAKYIAQRKGGWDAIDYARRLKNRAQFTCLGLGW